MTILDRVRKERTKKRDFSGGDNDLEILLFPQIGIKIYPPLITWEKNHLEIPEILCTPKNILPNK